MSCQFYDRQAKGADRAANLGQCRREAPSLSPLNQKSYMIEGVWPTVRDDDWCGEWKPLVRRVEPSRIGEVLGTSPPGGPRLSGVSPPPPRPTVADPLTAALPGFASSGRGND